MYDLGFPPELQKSIARKFNSSVHADYLVSYRPKHLVMESSRAALREPEKNYGYNVEYIGSMMTKMTGTDTHMHIVVHEYFCEYLELFLRRCFLMILDSLLLWLCSSILSLVDNNDL
jgi:hypothetical protein